MKTLRNFNVSDAKRREKLMDIDYNKLKSFLVVVKTGSITAAAKVLYRTQSAVSQTISGLEKNLGLKLIEWDKKQLKLTREGHLVYKAVHDRINAIDEELTTISRSGFEVGGCIEIGILQDHSSQIQNHFLTILANFRKEYPSVMFKIKFGTSYEIEQALLDQKIDMGLLINFRERHRFSVFEIAKEEHMIVTSATYLKQSGPFKSLKNVIQAELIDIDENFVCFSPWVRKHAPKLFQEFKKNKPVITVPDFEATKKLLLLGQGIGVVPKYLIQDELANGKLVQILPKLSTLGISVDCAFEIGRKERLCEQLFIEALKNTI